MGVKPELAFDVCWEVYRGAREVLETKRGISALNWKDTGKYLWRPDFRPRLNEWVADFALAGKAALDGPDWASRMVLFRLYYLGLAPYENARHFLGLGTSQPRHVPAAKILHIRFMKLWRVVGRNVICVGVASGLSRQRTTEECVDTEKWRARKRRRQ